MVYNVRKLMDTYFEEKELERNTVDSVDFILEVENVNEVVIISCSLLFRNSFSKDLGVLVQVYDGLITSGFTIESVGTRFVHPYPSAFRLVGNLGLLNQSLYQVFDSSRL